MSPAVALGFAFVVASIVIGVTAVIRQRRAAAEGTHLPTLPRWILLTLLAVGGVILMAVLAGVVLVVAS